MPGAPCGFLGHRRDPRRSSGGGSPNPPRSPRQALHAAQSCAAPSLATAFRRTSRAPESRRTCPTPRTPLQCARSRSPARRGGSENLQSMHRSVAVQVGRVTVGGGAPIVVQSMTNTDTADAAATAAQVAALSRAGSEIVRITVDRDEAAAAVPHIKERLLKMGVDVPIVGDFHYIGHKLLADHPAAAEALDKYRINPGNVGFKDKKDRQFSAIDETAIRQ